MIPFSKSPVAPGACVRLASANAIMGKRMPTKTSSPSRISRAAAATINSPREKERKAILEDISPDME